MRLSYRTDVRITSSSMPTGQTLWQRPRIRQRCHALQATRPLYCAFVAKKIHRLCIDGDARCGELARINADTAPRTCGPLQQVAKVVARTDASTPLETTKKYERNLREYAGIAIWARY